MTVPAYACLALRMASPAKQAVSEKVRFRVPGIVHSRGYFCGVHVHRNAIPQSVEGANPCVLSCLERVAEASPARANALLMVLPRGAEKGQEATAELLCFGVATEDLCISEELQRCFVWCVLLSGTGYFRLDNEAQARRRANGS